jgi:hypothetical protein
VVVAGGGSAVPPSGVEGGVAEGDVPKIGPAPLPGAVPGTGGPPPGPEGVPKLEAAPVAGASPNAAELRGAGGVSCALAQGIETPTAMSSAVHCRLRVMKELETGRRDECGGSSRCRKKGETDYSNARRMPAGIRLSKAFASSLKLIAS